MNEVLIRNGISGPGLFSPFPSRRVALWGGGVLKGSFGLKVDTDEETEPSVWPCTGST